jgi:hypothetical protein
MIPIFVARTCVNKRWGLNTSWPVVGCVGVTVAVSSAASDAVVAIAAVYAVGQISAISSTQFGGGGGNVSASSGGGVPSLSTTVGTPVNVQNAPTAPAQGTAATAQRTVNINMTGGDQFYSADAIRNQLIPALNEAVGDGVVINVGQA